MKNRAIGVALGALAAGLALQAQAAETNGPVASPGAGETALAAPAPVPGTLDFQYAALAVAAPAAGWTPAPPAEHASAPAASVAIARRAIDAAGAFDAYTRKASAIGGLKDGPGVIAAVDAASGYEASQLQEGAVAYGALAALQDPMFVDAVRSAAPDAAAREAMADRLVENPASVLRVPGAHAAAARVTRVVGVRGAALIDAGAGINKASYAVQHEAWSKAPLAHADADLKRVKARSGERSELSAAETQALMSGLSGLRKEAVDSDEEPGFRPTPATAQALALAALAVLGRAGEDHVADVSRLLSTDQGADCLKLAKLNLYQCLAVAGPHYEDMFCLGRHALSDTGQCLTSTAGWTGPAPAQSAGPVKLAVALQPQAPPVAAAVEVPIALASVDGPERTRAYADPETPAPPPAPPVADGSFAVARADVPTFRKATRPERIDQDEDSDGYGAPPPRLRADDGYGPPVRSAPRDAYDDEDAPPPPPRRYGASYVRYVGGPYGNAPAYGWSTPRGGDARYDGYRYPAPREQDDDEGPGGWPPAPYGGR